MATLQRINTEALQANVAKLTEFSRDVLIPVVEEIFADGRECRDCPFLNRWTEGHGERMRECSLLEARDGELAKCPGLE